jgi:hypothetical protein
MRIMRKLTGKLVCVMWAALCLFVALLKRRDSRPMLRFTSTNFRPTTNQRFVAPVPQAGASSFQFTDRTAAHEREEQH